MIKGLLVDDDSAFHGFIDVVSPSCGWKDISEDECFLRGCCWNKFSKTCGIPLKDGVSEEQSSAYVNYVIFKNQFGYSKEKDTNTSTSPKGKSIFESTPTPRPQVVTSAEPKATQSPDYNYTTEPAVTLPFMRKSKNARYRRSTFSAETQKLKECGTRAESIACMFDEITSSRTDKMIIEQMCISRGCCWDNDYYENMLEKIHQIEEVETYCKWSIGERFQIPDGFPSIEEGLKSCCNSSPCYQKKTPILLKPIEPSIIPFFPSVIVQRDETWSEWTDCVKGIQLQNRERTINRNLQKESRFCPLTEEWSAWRILSNCDRLCGGGSKTYVRNCSGTGCMEQVQYSYARCNTNPCNSWTYG